MRIKRQNSFKPGDLVTPLSTNVAYCQFGHDFGNSQDGYNSGGSSNFKDRGRGSNHGGRNGSNRGNHSVCQVYGKLGSDTKLIKSQIEIFEIDL
ncbi:hypothetical protein PanWU01x14_332550 [Parasponia andersonii]|uniref:Uncharacterized protein n=1 Tax=Parasponia andersonii TaxID=3476 RepID=A0A2P5AHB3_PARAD|nr:hypothetical protein PanWU01x14_332550 [Parasponia andersonii]